MWAVFGSSSHTVWTPRAEIGVPSLHVGLNFALCGLSRVSKFRDVGGLLPLAITVCIVVLRVVGNICRHDVAICRILESGDRFQRPKSGAQLATV